MRGYIRRRSKNGWQITINLDNRDERGRRVRKFVHVKGSQKKAHATLTNLLHALGHPQDAEGQAILNPSSATVGELLNCWLEEYVDIDENISLRTAVGHKEKIRNHIMPLLEDIQLAELTGEHVRQLHRVMRSKGLSGTTVLHAHRILFSALRYGRKRWKAGWVVPNIFDDVSTPKAAHREMVALDEGKMRQFLDISRNHRYSAFFYMALITGMRRSELLGLKWDATDLRAKTVAVTGTLQRINGRGLVRSEPKTNSSTRSIKLTKGSVTVLSGLLAKQKENYKQLGWAWNDSNFVFAQADGSPLEPDKVSSAFAKLISGSGLPHIRLHDLRHTMATLMLKNGEHPKVVSERLGHSSIKVTMDVYSHVLPGLQEEAAARLDDLIEGPAEVVEEVTA